MRRRIEKKRPVGRPVGRTGKPRNTYLDEGLWEDARILALVRDNHNGPSRLIAKLLRAEVNAVFRRGDTWSKEAQVAILKGRKQRERIKV